MCVLYCCCCCCCVLSVLTVISCVNLCRETFDPSAVFASVEEVSGRLTAGCKRHETTTGCLDETFCCLLPSSILLCFFSLPIVCVFHSSLLYCVPVPSCFPLHPAPSHVFACLPHCLSSPISWRRKTAEEGLVVERGGFQRRVRSNRSGRRAGRLVTGKGVAGDDMSDEVHPGKPAMQER